SWLDFFSPGGDMRQNLFYQADLVTLVVNNEVAFISKLFNVFAQNPNAKRMKRANRRASLFSFRPLPSHLWLLAPDALLHFPRRFICERHRQNILGPYAALDHIPH